jgi:hypothetical protein
LGGGGGVAGGVKIFEPMKLAKASQAEIDNLMTWLQAREDSDDPPPPFLRVVFGYETLLNNCADPAVDVLEFNPKLKAAMEDAKRLDWMEANSADIYEVHGAWYVYPDAKYATPGLRDAIDLAKL